MKAKPVPEVIYDDGITPKMRENLQEQGDYCPELNYSKIVEEAKTLDEEQGETLRQTETKQDVEDFDGMLIKEDEFLELFPQGKEKYQVVAPFKGKNIPLEVAPFLPDEGMDGKLLEVDQNIFADISEEDRKTLTKYNENKKLTKKEEKVIKRLRKLQQSESKKVLEKMNSVLTQHVILFGPDGSYYNSLNKPGRLKFWTEGSGADFLFKLNLFTEVMELIGATQNNMFKLFRLRG